MPSEKIHVTIDAEAARLFNEALKWLQNNTDVRTEYLKRTAVSLAVQTVNEVLNALYQSTPIEKNTPHTTIQFWRKVRSKLETL